MGLNIKNERVHALAREAARVTGLSQTSVIEEALEMLLAARGADPQVTRRERRREAARDVVLDWQALPDGDGVRDVADLYDDATGLPRR